MFPFRNEYVALGDKYHPLKLGPGFPDTPVPEFLIDALQTVARSTDPLTHQYTRGFVRV